MAWRSIVIVTTLAWTLSPGQAQTIPAQPPHRRPRHVLPHIYAPPILRPSRPPALTIEPPGRFMPPRIGAPSPLEEDQVPGPAPLSQGFHLTVSLDAGPKTPTQLNRAYEVGQALGACWTPPNGMSWTIITMRLSFKRDGSVNGEPRIPFSDAGSAQQKSDLAHSLLAALKDCTPLPFSPSLGSAIAGEMFAISFTHQDRR